MGNFRRLTTCAALGSAVLLALAACGDEKAIAIKRRQLLTPPPVAAQQAKKVKPPVVDEEGIPLPSDQVLAGFVVPRGFTLTKSYENEWYLFSNVVSAQAAAKYVEPRVFTGSIERTTVGGVRFETATLREAPSLPRLSIWISPIKGEKRASEMRIRRIPVQKAIKRTAESVAQTLRESARFAQ